jgi:thiamine pyrophosphokinase
LKGCAFIGGDGPSAANCKKLAAAVDVIAAADSGLILAEAAGLAPDWIVGDMDSLDDKKRLLKYPKECVLKFPRDKDLTDTEIAIQLLIEKGCTEIILIGGGGGRLAHTFALRSVFERDNCLQEWYTADEKILLLNSGREILFTAKKNNLISVFPVGCSPWSAKSKNLKWKLDDLEWNRGVFGISNIATGADVYIKSASGKFLIVIEGHLICS